MQQSIADLEAVVIAVVGIAVGLQPSVVELRTAEPLHVDRDSSFWIV